MARSSRSAGTRMCNLKIAITDHISNSSAIFWRLLKLLRCAAESPWRLCPDGYSRLHSLFDRFRCKKLPSLMAGIKDDGWASNVCLLLEVDQQLRRQCEFMFDPCPRPHLWGLSLFGTSVHFMIRFFPTQNLRCVAESDVSPFVVL